MTGLANLCVLATSALAVAGCVSRPVAGVYDVKAFGATAAICLSLMLHK